jgi:O-acetyl-ADP-ribose deacetylase (regulator of RNase III)
MVNECKVGRSVIRLIRDDITMLDIDAFVFYARRDLVLGSGFGTAIAVRGGPSVQEQLRAFGERQIGDVVITKGGNLKARHIVHAIGPRFQEPDLERKLRGVVGEVLSKAEEQGIRRVAFPAMGAGFYGVPLHVSADVSIGAAREYLARGSTLEEVVFCLLDVREFKAYEAALDRLVGASAAPAARGAEGGAA